MDLELHNRTALVCGSSRGLGLAAAEALAAEGCAVAMNGRDEDQLHRAVESVRKRASGTTIVGLTADVTEPDQAAGLVSRTAEALGSLDILLTNAAGPPATSFADASADAWQAALESNLLSTIHLCRAAVPAMRARGWGRVIMLSSIAAKQPLGNLILSTTARAGLTGFAKCLADEVARDGVTVNVVCPGYMRTERVDEIIDRLARQQDRPRSEIRGDLIADIPMGRIGDPAEFGSLVAFLASSRAAYITGTSLQIDGGMARAVN